MLRYKLYFLILFVVCFSYVNPGGSRRELHYNDDMTEVFGKELIDTKDSKKFVKHVIINMTIVERFKKKKRDDAITELYGDHRYIYPLYVAYYYQEFHLKINYDKILQPRTFCYNSFGKLSDACYDYVKIFEEDKKVQNILSDFDYDDVQIIKDKLNPLARSSDSTQGYNNNISYVIPPGVSSSAKRQRHSVESSVSHLNFNDEELQLLKNVFPDISEDQSSSSLSKTSSSQKENSSSQKENSSSQILRRNALMNALYYHMVGEAPERVGPTDESRRFFHKQNSYGHNYLNEIARKIRTCICSENFFFLPIIVINISNNGSISSHFNDNRYPIYVSVMSPIIQIFHLNSSKYMKTTSITLGSFAKNYIRVKD